VPEVRLKRQRQNTLPSKQLSFLLRRSLFLFPGILQLQITSVTLAYISNVYDSLFASLVAGSTPLIQCILTNGSRNSGVNLNGRGPLIDFPHQTTLLHSYWLLLTPNALHQPISFMLLKIMFQSLIWAVF